MSKKPLTDQEKLYKFVDDIQENFDDLYEYFEKKGFDYSQYAYFGDLDNRDIPDHIKFIKEQGYEPKYACAVVICNKEYKNIADAFKSHEPWAIFIQDTKNKKLLCIKDEECHLLEYEDK